MKQGVNSLVLVSLAIGMLISMSTVAVAQQAPPRPRNHKVITAAELKLRPAMVSPLTKSRVLIQITGDRRFITSNSIAEHETGEFPGAGNPNRISEQNIKVNLPVAPSKNATPHHFQLGTFGISVNGVLLEPQAAEWYRGRRGSVWQYDALGGAIPLGFDEHIAHVQPNGTYHYHGLPSGLLQSLELNDQNHSPLVGWAMDGFPIYALFGNDGGGKIFKVSSSYVLKTGSRPKENGGPGGIYDGAFVADYEFVKGRGDLDACNGRFSVTPEFPGGSYAYFLTETFPVIPRCFFGTAVKDAFRGGNGSGRENQGGRANRPDREAALQKAASDLGVSVNTLRHALGAPPPDFSRAAKQLGVSEGRLRRLLRP